MSVVNDEDEKRIIEGKAYICYEDGKKKKNTW